MASKILNSLKAKKIAHIRRILFQVGGLPYVDRVAYRM
jgi:hypothetical protein